VWGGSKKILYLLVFTYVGVIVGGSYSAYLLIISVNSPLLLTGKPNGCIFLPLKDDLWIGLVIIILSESLAFGLLIIKYTMHTRAFGNATLAVSRNSRGSSNILSVMTQDGIGYFAFTLAVAIANFSVLKSDVVFLVLGAIQNILCSRLLFHVRSAVNDPSAEIYASQITLSAPVFANISDGGDPGDSRPV